MNSKAEKGVFTTLEAAGGSCAMSLRGSLSSKNASSCRVALFFAVAFPFVVASTGCAPRSKSAHDHDTLVPERTQRESERNMTEQQVMMQDLNSTPSERAAAQHDLQRDRRHDRQNDKQQE